MEIGSAKVYFNARFDDVMLIVEREMASVLGGPFRVTYYFTMYIFPTLSGRRVSTQTTSRGKLCNCLDVIGRADNLILLHCGRTCSRRRGCDHKLTASWFLATLSAPSTAM